MFVSGLRWPFFVIVIIASGIASSIASKRTRTTTKTTESESRNMAIINGTP